MSMQGQRNQGQRRWRVACLASLAVATGALAAGVAVAVATTGSLPGAGSGSASAGSVSLRLNARATRACHYRFLVPGGLRGAATCALSVTYAGSIPAHLSLTVMVRSAAGSGGSVLYDGNRGVINHGGLVLHLTDGHRRFTVPTGPGRRCRAGFTCWRVPHDLAAWYRHGRAHLLFLAGHRVTFTLSPAFGIRSGNGFQGAAAVIRLVASAVQAPDNPLPRRCSAATIGRPCRAHGFFAWS